MGLLIMKNIHCVTDKALFDALNQSQISMGEMSDLFLDRGIIISKKTPRKDLAKNFSKFNHDYYDHQKIASYLGGGARKERSTSKIIESKLNDDIILAAADELKTSIEKESDLCQVYKSNGKIYISITYLSTNYGRSDFKQVIKKDALIEIERQQNSYVIRRPDNEQIENYEAKLFACLEKEIYKNNDEEVQSEDISPLSIKEISMEDLIDPNMRTLFFTKLITNLEGFVLEDVTDAYVFHPKPERLEEEDGNTETGVHVSRASLKGEGVLKSEELSSLYERGFYIWKIKWTAKENIPDPDIYEFEAQFSNQEEFKYFSYSAKSVKKYKGFGKYNKNFVSLTKAEENKFLKLIENAAYSIIMDLENQAQGE
ncbi:hypothetical protein ACTEV4_000809 [Cronobacter turicensis]